MAKAIRDKVTPVPVEVVAKTIKDNVVGYSKAQLVNSTKYANRRDTVSALLVDGKEYKFAEVDEAIKTFDEGVKS